MKSREEWYEKLVSEETRLGYDMGWKFLYCPWSTIEKAKVGFVSLNPGRAPNNTLIRTVSDESGNSYEVEKNVTQSPITGQFLTLCSLIGITPRQCLTGVIAPFRTIDWQPARDKRSLEIGKEFWKELLSVSPVKTLFAVGAETEKVLVEILSSTLDTEVPSGWGNYKIRRYAAGGRSIIALPHLSRFKLLSSKIGREQIKKVVFDNPLPNTGRLI